MENGSGHRWTLATAILPAAFPKKVCFMKITRIDRFTHEVEVLAGNPLRRMEASFGDERDGLTVEVPEGDFGDYFVHFTEGEMVMLRESLASLEETRAVVDAGGEVEVDERTGTTDARSKPRQ